MRRCCLARPGAVTWPSILIQRVCRRGLDSPLLAPVSHPYPLSVGVYIWPSLVRSPHAASSHSRYALVLRRPACRYWVPDNKCLYVQIPIFVWTRFDTIAFERHSVNPRTQPVFKVLFHNIGNFHLPLFNFIIVITVRVDIAIRKDDSTQ
jgi:hypothetical protein